MNAIEIRGLTKRYGTLTAVDGVTADIPQGEFFTLLGVNGAGKTTLIGMLSGVVKPDSGDGLLMGRSICTESVQAKRVIGISPQETAVAERLSVEENLRFMAEIHGMDAAQAKIRARESISDFSMEEIAGKRAGTLSGGWQRRLSIAMALVSRPQILFLDEPTLGLDVLARRELWAQLRRLQGRVTVMMTTHSMEEAQQLSDRIGIMQRGRLVAVGTARELMRLAGKERFEDAFVALAAPDAEEVEAL